MRLDYPPRLNGVLPRNIRPNYLLIQRLSRAQHRSNEVVLELDFIHSSGIAKRFG